MIKRSFLSIFSLLAARSAFAAACCGGGFAAPAVIVGDDRAQFTATYGLTRIAADVDENSLWRERESRETGETLKLEGAHVFRDVWQAGMSVPVVKRARGGESSTGLGDVAATLGYEYLPDWDYNPWRPHGIGFLQLTLPTGRSANEDESALQLDARGRGFQAIGAGTILTKTFTRWDVVASLDVHRSFPRSFSNSQSSGRLIPGFGGNLGVGAGYNLESWRFGANLAWTHEDAVIVEGPGTAGDAQRAATASLTASRMLPGEWAASFAYTDQTWFGEPLNTSLGRGVTLSLQKRWLR